MFKIFFSYGINKSNRAPNSGCLTLFLIYKRCYMPGFHFLFTTATQIYHVTSVKTNLNPMWRLFDHREKLPYNNNNLLRKVALQFNYCH